MNFAKPNLNPIMKDKRAEHVMRRRENINHQLNNPSGSGFSGRKFELMVGRVVFTDVMPCNDDDVGVSFGLGFNLNFHKSFNLPASTTVKTRVNRHSEILLPDNSPPKR